MDAFRKFEKWAQNNLWPFNRGDYPSPFPALQYSLKRVHSAFTFLAPMLHAIEKNRDKKKKKKDSSLKPTQNIPDDTFR